MKKFIVDKQNITSVNELISHSHFKLKKKKKFGDNFEFDRITKKNRKSLKKRIMLNFMILKF